MFQHKTQWALRVRGDHHRQALRRAGVSVLHWGLLAMMVGVLAACPPPKLPGGPGKDGQKVTDLRGGEAAIVVEAKGNPLIVDWRPEQRGDLEVAMRQGVAIVSYDSKGIRLLPDCKIEGSYGFIGVNRKEEVIRLSSADEVRANLPLGGAGILAQIGGELQRGMALDVAIVMVGKKRTTWVDPTLKDLQGSCANATHFVKGVTVGAFAMKTNLRDKKSAVAELFNAGGAVSTASASSVQNVDGLLQACQGATPDDPKPPGQCGALLRLELLPLQKAGATAAKAPTEKAPPAAGPSGEDDDTITCPQGFVFAQGKCTREALQEATHACKVGDVQDCVIQCDKGNAQSCDTLGFMFYFGRGVQADKAKAVQLFDKGCEGGFAGACTNLGFCFGNGDGVARNPTTATALFVKACADGNGLGCLNAGINHFFGNGVAQSDQRAALLFNKGCQAGNREACSDFGALNGMGRGVPQNHQAAAQYYKWACDGKAAIGCSNLGGAFYTGRGVPQDYVKALLAHTIACSLEAKQCGGLGIMYMLGRGVPHDHNKAREVFAKACQAQDAPSCLWLNTAFGERRAVDNNALKDLLTNHLPSCQRPNEADGCDVVALVAAHVGRKNWAEAAAKKGCLLGRDYCCELLKPLGFQAPPRGSPIPAPPSAADLGF